MIKKLTVFITPDNKTKINSDNKDYVKYNFNQVASNKFIRTVSNEKESAANVIAGGYNKNYSQPPKGEIIKNV